MGLREVNQELKKMDKTEIMKLISEMYKKIPRVKEFLDVFATGDIKQIAEKYKSQIEKFVYPHGNEMVLREKEARKLIQNIR
jgi:Zn-dependent M16 (insulinase) family peptidase